MDSRMRVSACGHRDQRSDTSSEAAAGDNGGVFTNPHMFLPDPAYLCGSNCLCVLAHGEVPSVQDHFGGCRLIHTAGRRQRRAPRGKTRSGSNGLTGV